MKPRKDQNPAKPRKPQARWAKVKPDDPLTQKEEAFKEEYVTCLNATKSYSLSHPGCTYKTAQTMGSLLLGKANVKAAIEKALEARKRRLGMTADEVLQGYRELATANMGDFVEVQNGGRLKIKPSAELSYEQMGAIQEIRKTKTGLTFKLHDRKGALDAMAAHLGINRPDPGKPPQPGDPNTVTHFHTTIPFAQIRQKAQEK